MQRKDYFVKILAKLQTTFNTAMDTPAELTTDQLTTLAKSYGLVESKRGRDGGYPATNTGLAFVGEDVQTFVLAEAQAAEERAEQAKVARKAATKQNQAALKEQLTSALRAA